MNCFRVKKTRSLPPKNPTKMENQHGARAKDVRHEVLVSMPSCKVHLMDGGEAVEVGTGKFTLTRIYEDDVSLAIIIKVGDELQWPLTKDEPVVRLDPLHYLFTLPVIKGGSPLSYGVTFFDHGGGGLGLLDKFLKENSCFSSSPRSTGSSNDVNWKEFAPRIEDYNNALAKAIAGGTGQIVKGIFKCSNAYTNQVQRGGVAILARPNEGKSGISTGTNNEGNGATKKTGINNTLKSVRMLSKMTENMSKAMLNGVGLVTGSAMAPLVRSQAGKAFLAMVPGEVLLASLDAVNVVLDAVEVAQKQALSATSGAATRMVSQRFGESAGEATGDVFATAGHCAGTAWNVVKIRKAINPASSISSGVLKNATKTRLS